jgi:hypothetical protein
VTKFVIRSSGSIDDNDEELIRDKKLIMLAEAVKYCESNDTNKIRYSELKKLCNQRLSELTLGVETDFGGNFEKYIVYFEEEPKPTRLLERQREGSKSYLIPNIQNIARLFERKNISKSLDERDFFKGIGYENDEDLGPSVIEGTVPKQVKGIEEMFLTGEARKHKLYAVTYYYKNGRPIFDEFPKSNSSLNNYAKDNAPFYGSSKYKITHPRSAVKMEVNTEQNLNCILTSDPWNICLLYPDDKKRNLQEENIQQLVSIGKVIASYDEAVPFKIIIEYNGKSKQQ